MIFGGLFLCSVFLYAADFYVVSPPLGADNNPGTFEAPFATISKAASVLQPGDVCYIRGGIYGEQIKPANSGTAGMPVKFTAYNSENVYVTGTATVPKHRWQPYKNGIVKADVSDLGSISQVFHDWIRMDVARFPNLDNDDLLAPKLGRAVNAVPREQPLLSEIYDPSLDQGDLDWTGADLWLLTGAKWVSFHAVIEEHIGPLIKFVFPGEISYAYQPEPGSDYFIYGVLDALDREKEWFYHDKDKILYFYPPTNRDLDVQVRVRQWGADLTGKKNIQIHGINFFAANINLHNAENCSIENCNIFFPVPFYDADSWAHTEDPQNGTGAGVKLGGSANKIRSCRIAYSWGDGISVYGTGNTVENCLVHDVDWLCTDNAAVHTSGQDHIIKGNSLYRAARSGLVHRKSKNLRIEYNDIYDCGLICTDLGATYCWQTDGAGTVIHHNWVHDVVTKAHTAGIYLDNGSSNFIVHHNVVWNTDDLALQTNLDAQFHEIYNNTFWNCSKAMGGGGGNILEGQIVYNNLSNSSDWFGTDVSNNLTVSDPKFVDAANGDFRLQAVSPARDDYQYVPEFINGGFESGTGGWSGAGADLTQISSPVHSGSFAALASNRHEYWEGARQTVTEILKARGPGRYVIEAWVMLASGSTNGYLRFKLVDQIGDSYPGTRQPLSSTEWRKLSYSSELSWQGQLQEAVFELMTTDNDKVLPDMYIDDCVLIPPANTGGGNGPVGGILIPGITDDVLDGKPDAGAYEYGGSNADWIAGSTLKPVLPFANGVDQSLTIPTHFELFQNYPNPFNPDTYICYNLREPANVQINIYNILGHKVRTLFHARQSTGTFRIRWDGRNDSGFIVAAGMYIYTFECGGLSGTYSARKKMVLLR